MTGTHEDAEATPNPYPEGPARVFSPEDAAYPEGLRRLDRHGAIRVRGRLESFVSVPCVGIVGTRHAEQEARDFAYLLAGDLTARGVTVVSGGARGIDAAAHMGALDAGGETVAVLATGFLRPYPSQHRGLFDRIAGQGALVTEAPEDAKPHGYRFLHRNRIIAALSAAVVVVQAPKRSGALSTAAHAKQLEIPVLAVPGAPWQPRSAGALGLLREGARICTSVSDVLSVIAPQTRVEAHPSPRDENKTNDFKLLSDEARRVLRALHGRARRIDEVASRAALPVHVALRTLTALELDGRVEPRGDGLYGLINARRRRTT